MGAGKTTIGRTLARITGKTFYDADHELEAHTGVKIPVIFEIEGEARFREREEEMIATLVCRHNIVLATGGGAVLSANNRHVLKTHGFVIYLYTDLDDLCARTRHDKNRPLLQTADPRERLEMLHTQRDPLYREIADMVVDTSSQHVHSIAHTIWEQLKTHHENS